MASHAQTAQSADVPQYVAKAIPDAGIKGQARMRYLMMDIYDATLYSMEGKSLHRPLALSLTYHRKLDGERIARRSVEEIRGQGYSNELKLAAWYKQLREIFPDVTKNVTLTGILLKNGHTVFYRDGREIGRITDTEFGPKFFDIWLGPKTSDPSFRTRLINNTPETEQR